MGNMAGVQRRPAEEAKKIDGMQQGCSKSDGDVTVCMLVR